MKTYHIQMYLPTGRFVAHLIDAKNEYSAQLKACEIENCAISAIQKTTLVP